MKVNISRSFFILFFLLLFFSITISVFADDDGDDDEGEDFAKAFGSGAIGFLGVGSIFIVAARINEYVKRIGKSENANDETESKVSEDWKKIYQDLYKQFRKPLLYLHNFTMAFATIIAAIHGVLLLEEVEGGTLITGLVALILMITLSTLGSIMFFKFKPVWNSRGTRKLTRFVHRQLILSVILIISLFLHTE